MKKIILFLAVAFMAVILFSSCNKKDDVVSPNYVSTVAGEIFIKNGDITLKSAPIPTTRYLYMYKGTAPSLSLVNGSEFLPGSAPAIFWSTAGNNPGNFPASVSVYSNYTPAMQIRMVSKTTNEFNKPAYLGIWDGYPSAATFPVTIQGRRLGDVLTLNTDALTSLPGYTNMSFTVSYDKGIINVDNTAITSGPTTTSWPTYAYSSTENVTDQVITGSGVQTVYDGVDAKILGTITIKIHVDATTIIVTTPASDMGHGLALTLKTDKVGWYDSATMGITDQPIHVDARDISVN